MPTPADARRGPARKTPEKKVDIGPQLARKRSQDFTSKVQGWNQTGAGVVQNKDEIVVVEEPSQDEQKSHTDEDASEAVPGAQAIGTSESSEDVPIGNENPPTPKTPASNAKPAAKTTTGKKATRYVDLENKAWVRRRSKPQAEIAIDLKHAGTPKKRVVSDGHWRRDRAPKDEKVAPEKEKDSAPKPITIRRSVVNVGLKVPPSVQDFVETVEPEPRLRSSRRSRSRSPSRSDDDRKAAPAYESTGTKLYIKRRKPSRSLNEDLKASNGYRTSESSFTAASSFEKSAVSTDLTTPSSSPTRDFSKRPVSEPRPLLRKSRSKEDQPRPRTAKRSPEIEDTPQRSSTPRRRSRTLVHGGDEHQRSSHNEKSSPRKSPEPVRKPAGLPAAPVAPRIHGNRIDGWLAGMSDPFTEPRDPSLTPPPLEISKKKSTKANQLNKSRDNDVKVSEESTGRRTSRRSLDRTAISDPSLRQSVDDWSDSAPSSTPRLRRSGARRDTRSPVKDRGPRQSTPPEDHHVMSGALPAADQHTRRPSATQSGRKFPSTGKQLSTIASIDTLPTRTISQRRRAPSDASEQPTVVPEGSVLSRASDGDEPRRKPSGIRRRGTKHSDLMSVLTSKDDADGITPSRSLLRRMRAQQDTSTVEGLMNQLSADELKYQRELRTLVDGVIPVLLQYTLSGSDGQTSGRVFSRSLKDPAVTKPITEMGIALERLKTNHRRIPMYNATELLTWAEGTSRIYADYLRSWRLGFKNIVVNLAPADESSKNGPQDQKVSRNAKGDLVDGHGEQVDVAYLLMRPLVRLKTLSSTFKGINEILPSANAEQIANRYLGLVRDAKQRKNDELARLEDEAAAQIDSTRARDPRSLAPITGVAIDATRCVRARDYFDMDLIHSSGQQMTCKIEIICRDDAASRGSAGDVLFCEVSTSGRWLLFPPIPKSLVSARKGDRSNEIVVMVRGFMSNAQQWREIMSLEADEDRTCVDWLQMLESSPIPSRLLRKSSFNALSAATDQRRGTSQMPTVPEKILEPSQREIEIPIGEQSILASSVWDGSEVNSVSVESTPTGVPRAKAKRYKSTPSSPIEREIKKGAYGYGSAQPDYFYDIPKHARSSEYVSQRPTTSRSRSEWSATTQSTHGQGYSVWMPSSEKLSDESSSEDDQQPNKRHDTRPGMHRRTSSVPSLNLPTIPKLRKNEEARTPGRHSNPRADAYDSRQSMPEPASAPSKMQKRPVSASKETPERNAKAQPTDQSQSKSLSLKTSILPSLTPAFLRKNRRPSSPLKHEYEPSTASDSLTDSDFSELDEDSETSGSTVEDEAVSTIGDLKAFHEYTARPINHQPPPSSHFSIPGPSLAPSESASQAPYRSVPATNIAPAKTVASIFSWADRGAWDTLHPEECFIFVTPGLIEAFDVNQAQDALRDVGVDDISTPSARGVKPLVAMELTPLVPIRRGTAVDISVRSPPTPASLLRTGNNIMFRSRSPEECIQLYNLINRARIDNPTFIALSNARGPMKQSNWAEVMDRRNAARSTSGSWWHLGSKKGSTYRSNGSRALSTAATDTSGNSINSAFSALRRFSGSNRIFNIAKSTITSREGTRSTNSDSLSSGVATPIGLDPRLGLPICPQKKMRLWIMSSSRQWQLLGEGIMTVLHPDPTMPVDPRVVGQRKRILIFGKRRGELMLDVTLGENDFERGPGKGVAMSVWKDSENVAAVGGVNPGKTTRYMLEMRSEAEAVFLFTLVGRARY